MDLVVPNQLSCHGDNSMLPQDRTSDFVLFCFLKTLQNYRQFFGVSFFKKVSLFIFFKVSALNIGKSTRFKIVFTQSCVLMMATYYFST